MKRSGIVLSALFALFFTVFASSCTDVQPRPQEEEAALTELLGEFLENVDDPEMHDRLWAEDLVYTGSAGVRHGKDVIMNGMRGSDSDSDTTVAAGPSYSYDNLMIKVFGNTAGLTFRLIAETPSDSGSETSYYLNSGFFEKRGGQWKAVIWQATRMAESE